jgi:hypothetical protein
MPTTIDPSPRTNRLQIAVLLACLAGLISAAAWLVFVSGNRSPRDSTKRPAERWEVIRLITFDRPFPSEGRFVGDPYIGSRVCGECHPAESAAHSRTGHAATLRPAARVKTSRRLDGTIQPDPEIPGVTWSYHYEKNQLHIAREAGTEVQQWIADYAIGSGHHALTYVSVIEHRTPLVLEHRLTYYQRDNGRSGLGITPGHDTRPAPPGLRPHGGELPPRVARECFRCHATQLAAVDDEQRFDENYMIPNVSCERCHGPGRAHVEVARRRASEADLTLPFGPDRYTAESLLSLCGSCHRLPNPSQAGRIKPDNPTLVRFQPLGISQSRCYQKSAGGISCVTCHDAHGRVSRDRPAYEQVCLSCHGGRGERESQNSAGLAPACPVSAKSRCVECHMPRKDVGQGILFSDHWIRVHPRGEAKYDLQGSRE